MSSSNSKKAKSSDTRDKYTQISLFQAFNVKPKTPSSSSSSSAGPHRNTSNGTSSRYFEKSNQKPSTSTNNVHRRADTVEEVDEDEIMPDAPEDMDEDSQEFKHQLSSAEPKSRMDTIRPEPAASSKSTTTYRREIVTDPTSGRYHNEAYAAVAKANIEISKIILPYIFSSSQSPEGYLYDAKNIQHLDSKYCPGYTLSNSDEEAAGKRGCRIRVVDGDTYDVACEMLQRHKKELESSNHSFHSTNTTSTTDEYEDNGPVILNMANQKWRGGGWMKGCMAQEEELCYRSTLHASLPRKFYPMSDTEGIYSPYVAVIRSRCNQGHKLYPMAEFIYETHQTPQNVLISTTPPKDELPVVSVITIAAVRDPELKIIKSALTGDDGEEHVTETPRYRRATDKFLMMTKMRMILRMAALNGHRRLVLGSIGCGAFNNPKLEVVEMFKEVLLEKEFQGGWWKEVVFAVLDTEKQGPMKGKDGMGNLGLFYRGLDGLVV